MLPWFSKVGSRIDRASLNETVMLSLAGQSLEHAYRINRPFFATRVTKERIRILDEMVAEAREIGQGRTDPLKRLKELAKQAMPEEDSAEEIVPGLVGLIDAGVFLGGYSSPDGGTSSLYYAIAQSYMSVSNRACAEAKGAEGNCVYMDEESDAEVANPLCSTEIDFQLKLIDALE